MKKDITFKWVTDLETVLKLNSLKGNKLYIDTAWGVKRVYSVNRDYDVHYYNPKKFGEVEYISEYDLSYGMCHAGTPIYVGLNESDYEEDYKWHLVKDTLTGVYMILENGEDVDWEEYWETKLKVTRNRWEYLYSFNNPSEAKMIKIRKQREFDRLCEGVR